jgi:enamine deaminase RidA (YjgF/YER057c/UK114 family)
MTDAETGAEARLAALGIVLPAPAAPIASYVPAVIAGGMLHVSGQLPFAAGDVVTGRLATADDIAAGQDAARLCAVMLLAQARAALGGLDRIAQVVKLNVFVASAPDFTDQPRVANGASDLMQAVFGAAGQHARAAVGVAALPLGAMVEVDALFALRD